MTDQEIFNPALESISELARSAYTRLMKQIEAVRANQGSAGCYMELLNTLAASANRLLVSRLSRLLNSRLSKHMI